MSELKVLVKDYEILGVDFNSNTITYTSEYGEKMINIIFNQSCRITKEFYDVIEEKVLNLPDSTDLKSLQISLQNIVTLYEDQGHIEYDEQWFDLLDVEGFDIKADPYFKYYEDN